MNAGDEKRSYSEADKAGALAVLAGNAGNLKKTSERLGIPLATLANWRNGEHINADVTKKCDVKKGELADKCDQIAQQILNSIDEHDIKAAPLNLRTVAFGTLVDKARLLREQPTPDAAVLADTKNPYYQAGYQKLVAAGIVIDDDDDSAPSGEVDPV
jgi:hypothetical protein